jgi:hypothetical protein
MIDFGGFIIIDALIQQTFADINQSYDLLSNEFFFFVFNKAYLAASNKQKILMQAKISSVIHKLNSPISSKWKECIWLSKQKGKYKSSY